MMERRIAIMGGCLNTGYHLVPLSALYHRILVKDLQECHGMRARVALGRMESHQMGVIMEQALALLEESRAEVLVVQLRPEMLWGLCTACWLSRSGAGVDRLRRNPHVRYGARWPEGLESQIVPMTRRFRLCNCRGGRAIGAEKEGLKLLGWMIAELRDRVRARGAELALLSPVFGDAYHPVFKRRMVERIAPLLERSGVPVIDLLRSPVQENPASWVGDGFHLSADGHREVARLALAVLGRVLVGVRG